MGLPKQVQAQIDEANKILETVAEAVPPPVAEPQVLQDLVQEPPAEPQGQPPAAAAPPAEPDPWEHKYNVLKGKYDAEVPRMAREIREMRAAVEQSQAMIEALQQQQQPPAAAKPGEFKFITPEEVSDYGAELTDFMGRVAKEQLDAVAGSLQQELSAIRQQLGMTQQKVAMTDKERMYSLLDKSLPEWREVNRDPTFLAWLEAQDPYTGYPRRELLMGAYEQNNAERLLAFFNGYINEHAAVTPSTGEAPRQPQVSLETMVAPGAPQASGPAGTPLDRSTRILTQAEIDRFYADVHRGRYRGREADKAKIEAQIMRAVRENRVA